MNSGCSNNFPPLLFPFLYHVRSSRSSSQVDDSTGRLQGHTTLHDMSNSFFLISASLSRSLSTNTYICLSIYLSIYLTLTFSLFVARALYPSISLCLPLSFCSVIIDLFLFPPPLSLSLSLSFFLLSSPPFL